MKTIKENRSAYRRVETPSTLFTTAAMDRVFSLKRQLQLMVRFEWALSIALESCGVVPAGFAGALEPLLRADFIDAAALARDAYQAGNLAIPFVKQLTAAVREVNPEASANLHLGATSQDVLDTAVVLQMREAFALLRSDLDRILDLLERRTREHAESLMPGRTWLQQGPPVTLGLKLAGVLAALQRHRRRLDRAESAAVKLQFGGAVGTLAALGEQGRAVSAALARALDLAEPEIPWHTHRDDLVEVATSLGLLTGTLGKFARDLSLLMQSEVGEVLEGDAEGRGGSSTMPHKRNPVAAAIILSAAMRVPGLVATLLAAMLQEHERGLGGWHAEWETLPEIFRLAAISLARTIEILEEMEVNRERMRANLDRLRGLALSEAVSTALAERIGRQEAHRVLEQASRRTLAEKLSFEEVLESVPEVRQHLGKDQLKHLLEPSAYLGSTQRYIEAVLHHRLSEHEIPEPDRPESDRLRQDRPIQDR